VIRAQSGPLLFNHALEKKWCFHMLQKSRAIVVKSDTETITIRGGFI